MPPICSMQAQSNRLPRRMGLLEAVASDATRPLSELDLHLEGERDRLLVAWNATAQALPEATLAELFERQVERSPGAIALVYGETRWTFAELNAQANRLAHGLIDEGMGPECLVAVALPRSPGMVVAMLAVLKSGAAYLPVDPAYPAERIDLMLADACPARVIVASGSSLSAHPRALCLDSAVVVAALAQQPATDRANGWCGWMGSIRRT